MVDMFKTLDSSGLRGFLGFLGLIYEEALIQFFAGASVVNGAGISTVGVQKVTITQQMFVEEFPFPSEGTNSFSSLSSEAIERMKLDFSLTCKFQAL
ncbi:hypothetical protein F511_03947 [Dorcoceras hygrometricum]|uniref:Uncharacterized protein n=1 Tax=Dorcoceras hygrometricum TaxID=472368 RepID=A0A2Z7BSR2_9LAMI|nr:hypothetical protein F511_03947 [Dorcoceras hygrometricum]